MDGGAGPLTSRFTSWSWRAVLAVAGRGRDRVLSAFGPIMMVATIAIWAVLLLAGWVLVFAGGTDALVSSGDPRTPADWTDRVWFVAYAMSTMGNGDFSPSGGAWQITASATTLTAFFVASLVISYILSILGAVVHKRAFAAQVTALGHTADAVLQAGWDRESFRSLDLPLSSLTTQLAELTERYLSYPVLQYFHATKAGKSPGVAIALLDEALTVLRFGVPRELRPNPAILTSARATVEGYLDTLPSRFIDPAEEPPPPPTLDGLRAAGIPTLPDDEFARAVEGLADRRRKLLGLVRSSGWEWSEP